MALFSRLRDAGRPKIDARQALMTPAICAIMADGKIDDDEMLSLAALLGVCKMFAGITSVEISMAFASKVAETVRAAGREKALADAARSLDPEGRETAMCLAIGAALSDGRFDEAEIDALLTTARILEIDRAAFDKIVDVMVMLRRGPEDMR